MSRIDSDIWTRLGEGRARGEFLWARWAAPDMTQRLLAAVDSNSKRHLLIRLQPGDAVLSDERSRGLEVATRDLSVPGQDIGRYLDVTCQDASGHEAFDLIGGELAERLAKERESAAECVTRVLAKWRRFWGEPPRQMLSREEQLGLFAELWFLSVWLVPRLGSDEAVKRWRGAFGARHDFEWPGRSVEVKATTSSRGAIHRIHGIEQLMPPDSGELLLFSLRLREEAGGGNSLPRVIMTWPVETRLAQRRMDRTTSRALTGVPSWKARPGRSTNVQCIPSGLVSTLSAICRRGFKVESIVTSTS